MRLEDFNLKRLSSLDTTYRFNRKAVVYHLYFPELVLEAISTVLNFKEDFDIIFTISESLDSDLVELIRESTLATVFICTNSGRDQRPWLTLVHSGYFDKYELICKLHGKRSLHRVDGDEWRKHSIKTLCGSENRINFICKLMIEKKINFVASKRYSLLPSKLEHWKGQEYWLNKISDRMNIPLNYGNLNGLPIPGGSFFWVSKEGLARIKSIPIMSFDWLENFNQGFQRDGNLEHFAERIPALSEPYFLDKAKICFLEKNSENYILFNGKEKVTSSKNLNKLISQDLNKPKLINFKNSSSNLAKNSNILGYYKVTTKSFINKIDGFLLDLSDLEKTLNLDVYFKNLKVFTIICEKESKLLPKKSQLFANTYHRNYGFNLNIPTYIDIKDVCFKTKLLDKEIILEEFSVEKSKSKFISEYLSLKNLGYTYRFSPEQLRQSEKHPTEILKNSRFDYDIKNVFQDINLDKIHPSSIFHVFVVNNPVAEIATIRTIKKLKLQKEKVLIILHRRESTSLLINYKRIKTTFPDIEHVNCNEELKNIFEFIKSLKKSIKFNKFEFYAHHYFSIFTYLIAWDNHCLSANLIEEGNLSSVELWEKESIELQSFCDNFSLFYSSNYVDNNMQKILFNYFKVNLLNKAYILKVLKIINLNYEISIELFLKLIDKESLLEDDNSYIDVGDKNLKYMYLLCMQRFYFWHPKMAIGCKFYSLSKAFKKQHKYYSINAVSQEEIDLKNKYKSLVKNPFALFIIPAGNHDIIDLYGKFHLNPFYKRLIENNKNLNNNSYYILHPSKRNDKNQEELVMGLPSLSNLQAKNITNIIIDSPVTEILSTLFKYVIHYGSSLSLTLSQYNSNVEEYKLKEFR